MKKYNLVYYCIILYYSITFPSSYAVATAENFKFQKKRGALLFDEKSQHMLLYRSADAWCPLFIYYFYYFLKWTSIENFNLGGNDARSVTLLAFWSAYSWCCMMHHHLLCFLFLLIFIYCFWNDCLLKTLIWMEIIQELMLLLGGGWRLWSMVHFFSNSPEHYNLQDHLVKWPKWYRT